MTVRRMYRGLDKFLINAVKEKREYFKNKFVIYCRIINNSGENNITIYYVNLQYFHVIFEYTR